MTLQTTKSFFHTPFENTLFSNRVLAIGLFVIFLRFLLYFTSAIFFKFGVEGFLQNIMHITHAFPISIIFFVTHRLRQIIFSVKNRGGLLFSIGSILHPPPPQIS